MARSSWDTIRRYTGKDADAAAPASAEDAPTVPTLGDAPTIGDAPAPEADTAPPSAQGAPTRDEKQANGKGAPAQKDKQKKPLSVWERIAALPQKAPHVETPLNPVIERVSNAPTPGGIGVLVLALLFFVLAIVPVGPQGETRLLLMWKALTGNVTLPTDIPPGAQQQADLAAAEAYAAQYAQNVAVAAPIGAQTAAEAALQAATLGSLGW